jgi:hypothetical protein
MYEIVTEYIVGKDVHSKKISYITILLSIKAVNRKRACPFTIPRSLTSAVTYSPGRELGS